MPIAHLDVRLPVSVNCCMMMPCRWLHLRVRTAHAATP
jgi:hypothetical protein